MRTRSNSKRLKQSAADGPAVSNSCLDSERQSSFSVEHNETLENISRNSVRKLIKKARSLGGSRFSNADDTYLHRCSDSSGKILSESQCKGKQPTKPAFGAISDGMDIMQNTSPEVKAGGKNSQHLKPDIEEDELDWEDGSIPASSSEKAGVTIEFDVPEGSAKRKTVRRVTAEEKDLAELVHKVHLLCLLGRGRLVDCACNDPLIQASLLSLLPTHLLKISDGPSLTSKSLSPIVSWFHKHFRVGGPSATKESIHLAMISTIASREGSLEVVAGLFVALLRALNITSRFVSILDVSPLKPDAEKPYLFRRAGTDIFKSSTLMVAGSSHSPAVRDLISSYKRGVSRSSSRTPSDANKTNGGKPLENSSKSYDSSLTDTMKHGLLNQSESNAQIEQSKRKGDLEFELQLEMALSATAVESVRENYVQQLKEPLHTSSNLSPYKIKNKISEDCSDGISTAIGSKKVGAPLYWAEVYCSGENLTGKWVHVDSVNAIVDGEQNVEVAAAACKIPLIYVVAFAGNGAKDVTRRYCTKWYKIRSKRANSHWWDEVLEPLKKMMAGLDDLGYLNNEVSSTGKESITSGKGVYHSEAFEECSNERRYSQSSSMASIPSLSRSDVEDMELETKALTEPMPTNQQAYRTHHLYAIEKWLNKYQVLYPKGPVLGFCSGHPVYPRTCVQTLQTKQRWLRDGLQVKANEPPAKILKHSQKKRTEVFGEDGESSEGDSGGTIELYGRWQTEPLSLPPAVNGIVPKNERGQVDVWSEKCLPPGTVHLPLPRVYLVAKRLEIDFAPAMVGFDFRNSRSVPVFKGIVVCAEFKDAILEAYAEEEERREAVEKHRAEAEALSRWYQLLSSIITRQRLNNAYASGGPSSAQNLDPDSSVKMMTSQAEGNQEKMLEKNNQILLGAEEEHHEHVFFLQDDQTLDADSSNRTKRCCCGFSIQFEEL
ncbi:unnamed protein product [Cuscuta epithymum]|uniref:DNA repair protein RAD4 n=1 Tax=Cuscuta epithymum TaxID=186058 RepID=A0AAV0FDL5_9ASTE|nr:unnamed protein product [Cuscuta epithymum]